MFKTIYAQKIKLNGSTHTGVKQLTHKSDIMTTQKSARDLKNVRILLVNSAEDLGSRTDCCWGYVSMIIHLKSYIFPVKVVATLLSVSWNGAVGGA